MTNAVASLDTENADNTGNTNAQRSEAYLGALRSVLAKEPRREALLRVARHEFATHGFIATTLSTIAQRAGIRKSTIFHYFPNKEALYDGAVTHALDEVASASEDAARVASNEPALSRLDAVVTTLALAFARENAIARLLMRTMIEEPVAHASVREKTATSRIVLGIAAAIRAGVDEGHIPRCAAIQQATSVVCVICASNAAMAGAAVAGAAPGALDEPVLIGVTDAQRAAAVALQVQRLLNSSGVART